MTVAEMIALLTAQPDHNAVVLINLAVDTYSPTNRVYIEHGGDCNGAVIIQVSPEYYGD